MSDNRISTAELAAKLADDPGVREDVEREIANGAMISYLIKERFRAGISQKALAAKLGWSPSKLSRIEAGTDDQISFMDVAKYLAAIGLTLHVFTTPAGNQPQTSIERMKMHVTLIQEHLDALCHLSKSLDKHEAFRRRIAEFKGEVLLNLLLAYESEKSEYPVFGRSSVYQTLESVQQVHEPLCDEHSDTTDTHRD